jgi:hypothetical protein
LISSFGIFPWAGTETFGAHFIAPVEQVRQVHSRCAPKLTVPGWVKENKMPIRRRFAIAKQMKLLEQARGHAVKNGAVPTPDGFYELQLETSVGLLRISFSQGLELASVMCRFEEPERAAAMIGRHNMNPFSGKWNRHWGRDDDHELALRTWKADLDRLTAEVSCT